MSAVLVLSMMGVVLLGLFGVAHGAERLPWARAVAAHPVTAALALGVYCTTWTFYGSVGRAATGGLAFLPVYLGPTVLLVAGSGLYARVIALRDRHHLTSVADFVAARYGRSPAVAALVTVVLGVGLVPYFALQVKAVLGTFARLTGERLDSASTVLLVLALAAFTVLFGLRRLDPGERHPGVTASLAAESVLKLAALTVVGGVTVAAVFHGPGAFFAHLDALGPETPLGRSASAWDVVQFLTVGVLSASAFALLPRQFHVGIVEAHGGGVARTARWLTPAYLLGINLFIVPLALAPQVLGLGGASADLAVLDIPLHLGLPGVSLLVFLGGFGAAVSMLTVESIALSTMVSNHLVMPLAQRFDGLRPLRARMREVRWAATVVLLLAGWRFAVDVGATQLLADIGLLSFAATFVLVPVVLGGLAWRRASPTGAVAGLLGGFATWLYALLLPAVVRSGWLPQPLLVDGPWGLAALRPEALFGFTGLPPLTHGALACLVVGGACWAVGSLVAPATLGEQRLADVFFGAELPPSDEGGQADGAEEWRALERVFVQYLPEARVAAVLEHVFATAGAARDGRFSLLRRAELLEVAERTLAGAIGTAAAHAALRPLTSGRDDLRHRLEEAWARELGALGLTPRALRERIDFQKERERLLSEQARELEDRVRERDGEIAERRRMEEALAISHAHLEDRVKERTVELEEATARALEASRVKSEFLATMSHEIRTPMNGVLGILTMLNEGRLGHEERHLITTAISSAEALLRVLNDILDLTRLDAGKVTLERHRFSPASLARGVGTLFQARVREKQLALEVRAGPSLPDWAWGDELRLRQVLINLVSNAVKFTEQGGVRIEARVHEGRLVFEVRDTGVGLSQEKAQRLFERFDQQDASTTRRFGGTGLGLSITRGLVDLMGGTVRYEPLVPGSAFVVELVLEVAEAPPTEAPRAASADATFPGVRVLVVDDNTVNRTVARGLLTKLGCEVLEASHGQQAVELTDATAVQLVFMDCYMPELDGFDATRAIRRREAERGAAPLPIVAMTASALLEDVERCHAAGMNDVVAKPVRRLDFVVALSRWVAATTPGPTA